MTNREVAWRVFAGEYNSSTLELASKKEREPGYLITPLGAKINRVYIVGVLTEVESLERNGSTHYRARVSDRTGVFFIYAGQYDPEVAKVLSNLEPPAYVAVVGKSRKYSPSEGVSYVSIRPESITVVDKNARDYWLLDASKNLKTRLEAVVEAQQMEPPVVDKLMALGINVSFAEGITDALEHYPKIDISFYRNMLLDVLKYLVIGNGDEHSQTNNPLNNDLNELDTEFTSADEYSAPEDKEELEFEPNTESIETPAEQLEQQEKLLEIVSSFKGKKYKDGVPWHELIAKADSEGIDKNIIEDLVNGLLNTGKIYEPMLGRIRCTNS